MMLLKNPARTVFRRLRTAWHWINKPNIICGFLVTMLGVWAAFALERRGEQSTLDNATRQRLHIVVLESQYNITTAKKILDACAKTIIITERPNTTAAVSVLEDANIISFLPHHKISQLRSYVNAVATLNEALRVYQSVLERDRYASTPAEALIRENVRSNAAAVAANAKVLREELQSYFDETSYDHEAMQDIEKRVKLYKGQILRGELSLSKER